MLKKSSLFLDRISKNCYLFCQQKVQNKHIPNAQYQIDKFKALQSKLTESQKLASDLQKQVQLAEFANITTTFDAMRRIICKMTGSNFETAAVKKLRQQLISHRNNLQKKIQESDIKWQGPREQILKLRKQMTSEFLIKFTTLEDKMQRVIEKKLDNQELAEGAELTYKLLRSSLSKHGIQFYNPEIGMKFNTQEHETVDETPQNKQIAQIMFHGWKIQDRIIKKAVVRVK